MNQEYLDKVMGQNGFTVAATESFGDLGKRALSGDFMKLGTVDQRYSSIHRYSIYYKQKNIKH